MKVLIRFKHFRHFKNENFPYLIQFFIALNLLWVEFSITVRYVHTYPCLLIDLEKYAKNNSSMERLIHLALVVHAASAICAEVIKKFQNYQYDARETLPTFTST